MAPQGSGEHKSPILFESKCVKQSDKHIYADSQDKKHKLKGNGGKSQSTCRVQELKLQRQIESNNSRH